MTDAEIKKIDALKQENNKLEDKLKELNVIQEIDDETKKEIQSLNEQIGVNNLEIERLTEQLKKEIEEKIEKFNRDSAMIENHLERIKSIFVLETDIEKLDVNEELGILTEELNKLSNDASELVGEMQDFKKMIGREDFNLTPKEIEAKVKKFKDRLRDLKRDQIINYNTRVENVNLIIKNLKENVKEDSDAFEMVNNLELLPLCSKSVREWRYISYKDEIKYSLVLETVNKIREIDEKLERDDSLESLEGKFAFVNDKVLQLEVEIEDNMDYASVVSANEKLVNISDLLLAFGCRLERLQSEMPSQLYEDYNNKYRELMQNYMSIEKRLRNIEKNIAKNEIVNYDVLSSKIEVIDLEVNSFAFNTDSLFGLVVSNSFSIFENRYKTLCEKVSDFNKVLEETFKNGILDENQYKNLTKRVKQVEELLNKANLKLKDPKMFNVTDVTDIYVFLNGSIDGIESTLNELEKTIGKLKAPVKDKETRKNIDAIFKKIESEIKLLEKQLEMYKDKDEEKYNSTKERLDAAKQKMSALGKQYRRSCPLRVKSVKSAKNFFKKYKKKLLIVAGLAAFAMLAHSIIIPAIMHGNIMLAYSSPMLRGPIKTINNLLGGLIGATKDSAGLWYLANGSILNPTTATSSLLKGLAISGVGSAALLSPVIVSIKKLVEKMNMAELKQKLSEGKDKVVTGAKKGVDTVKGKLHAGKETIVSGVEKVKDKASELVDASKDRIASLQAKKGVKKSVVEIINEYVQSGQTVKEFCEERNINGVYAQILMEYEQSVLEKKKGKGGK